MATVILTKWGNSMGIRIPAAVLKETHWAPGDELQISVNKKGGITIMPIKKQQSGWTEKFNVIADAGHDESLFDLPDEFDEEEWTW
jgi:antitoxin component of MazEF toxin-antitoxin module